MADEKLIDFDYIESFIAKTDKEDILRELFNLLDVHCLVHANVDHKKLDINYT